MFGVLNGKEALAGKHHEFVGVGDDSRHIGLVIALDLCFNLFDVIVGWHFVNDEMYFWYL